MKPWKVTYTMEKGGENVMTLSAHDIKAALALALTKRNVKLHNIKSIKEG